MLMVLMSLLPVGLAQTWASVQHGMWYARSADFLQMPVLEVFRWMRTFGDTIFAAGILVFGWFVIGLSTGWSVAGARTDSVAAEAGGVGGSGGGYRPRTPAKSRTRSTTWSGGWSSVGNCLPRLTHAVCMPKGIGPLDVRHGVVAHEKDPARRRQAER